MMRFLFLFAAAAPLLWCQAEGRYRYAAISVKQGLVFQAKVEAGEVTIARQDKPRFMLPHPGGGGRSLPVAALPNGDVVAGAAESGTPELFVAVRAAAGAVFAPGDWSAVAIDFDGGKSRGLRTSFIDFTVAGSGAIVKAVRVSHEAAVDDICRAEAVELKRAGDRTLEIDGARHDLAVGAAGGMFLATVAAPAHPGLVIAIRRDREGNTMSMRGSYALAELGARNSFAFAPDQAKFYSTLGTLEANGGQARLRQRIVQADSATEFSGAAAYMVSSGGAGTFSPRLEQRRRNLALAADGALFITAQAAEAGELSLLHGVGVGLRVMGAEQLPPVLARRATAQGSVISLYGERLEGVQVLLGGQQAAIVQAWPNQINVRLEAPPVSPLSVELAGPGGRVAAVPVTIAGALPDMKEAPPAPGGFVVPAQAPAPGDTIELAITGGALPNGTVVLFEGLAGTVVSSRVAEGTNRVKVTLPKGLAPGSQVNVAVAMPGYYVDLGDIAVSRPHAVATPAPAASAH